MGKKAIKREIPSEFEGMWLFAMFDLPVKEKKERKEYSIFIKRLISEGFTMLQFSVYARYFNSRENSQYNLGILKKSLPSDGQVRLICVTDKQFSDMVIYYGKKRENPEKKPEQLILF